MRLIQFHFIAIHLYMELTKWILYGQANFFFDPLGWSWAHGQISNRRVRLPFTQWHPLRTHQQIRQCMRWSTCAATTKKRGWSARRRRENLNLKPESSFPSFWHFIWTWYGDQLFVWMQDVLIGGPFEQRTRRFPWRTNFWIHDGFAMDFGLRMFF